MFNLKFDTMYLTEKLLAFSIAMCLFGLFSCVDPVDTFEPDKPDQPVDSVDSTDVKPVSFIDFNKLVLGNYNYKFDQNYSHTVSVDIDDDKTADMQIYFQNKYGRIVGVESYINIKPLNGSFLLISIQPDTTSFSGLRFDTEWEFSREFRDFFTQDSLVFYPGFSKGDTISVKMKHVENTVMLRYSYAYGSFVPTGHSKSGDYGLKIDEDAYVAFYKPIDSHTTQLTALQFRISSPTSLMLYNSRFIKGADSLRIE